MNTAILTPAFPRFRLPRLLTEFFRREPVFAGIAVCLTVLMLPTLVAVGLDTRTLIDVNVWDKPLKFEVALIVYTLTLAWYAGWLPRGTTERRWYRAFAGAVAFCIAAEMTWLIGAAAKGAPSHFNTTDPFLSAIYPVMGLLAVGLTSATLVYGVLILRDRSGRLAPAFRLAAGLGLVLTFMLTVIVAGYMASGAGHFVGGNLSDGEGAPIMGWACGGGDLRVAHFFATYAMQLIPALGFVASRMLNEGAARRAVLGSVALFVAFVGYCFIEALAGLPFMPMLGSWG